MSKDRIFLEGIYALVDRYDDGLTTKGEMVEALRIFVEQQLGEYYDAGFQAGLNDPILEDDEFEIDLEDDNADGQ